MSNLSFSHIPLTSIDRIEIVRGGSSATLYGSGAVGGSINVVTKNDTTYEESLVMTNSKEMIGGFS